MMKLSTILEFPLSHVGGYYTHDAERERDKILAAQIPKSNRGYTPSKYFKGILGRYSSRDKAIITHPKTVRTLEQKLSNSEYNFNILFYEMNVTDRQSYESKIRQSADSYIHRNNLDMDNSITFVKNGSSGDSLTPWMILHCIGHAAFDFAHKKDKMSIYDSINLILKKFLMIDNSEEDEEDRKAYHSNSGVREHAPDLLSVASEAFVFSSIRQKKVDDEHELLYELMAEYLWNGSIRINRAYANGGNRSEILTYLAQLNASYDAILKRCVGSIILDIT